MLKVQPQSEVKVKISHHTVDQSQATVSPSKELVFVMDVPKEPKATKKDKKSGSGKNAKDKDITAKSFGSYLSIPKFKNSENLTVSWRCRLDSQGDGFKTIMPIRPVAILAGNLELDNENINLLWVAGKVCGM